MNKDVPDRFDVMRAACAEKPHGTRQRYVGGCRCVPCRAANSRYATRRVVRRQAGDWNGIVPADRARAHVLALGLVGVGYKSVARAARVSINAMAKIRSGQKRQIRGRTERKILAVDESAIAGGALVDARPAWKKINALIKRGFTRVQIAEWLGKKLSLQLGRKRMTAKNALAVEQMCRMLDAGELRRTR